jgi:hypothetical protein
LPKHWRFERRSLPIHKVSTTPRISKVLHVRVRLLQWAITKPSLKVRHDSLLLREAMSAIKERYQYG